MPVCCWFQLYIDFLCGNGEIVFGSQRMWSVPQVVGNKEENMKGKQPKKESLVSKF